MNLRDGLIKFISENLIRDGSATVSADASLIAMGLVDSIGLMQILGYVENEAQVRIPDHLVTPDHFETVEAIVSLVEQLRQGA